MKLLKLSFIFFITLVITSLVIKKEKVRFVEINGKKQYYFLKGKNKPTLVFINGLGPEMDEFFPLQHKLANQFQTLSYNRAGIGKSEAYNNERNLENICNELHELLNRLSVKDSIVLVGHSRGGLIARYYQSKFPDKIIGMLLIDPAIPELWHKKIALRTTDEQKEFDAYYKTFYTDSVKYSATIRNEFKQFFNSDSASMVNKVLPTKIPLTLLVSTKVTTEKYSAKEVQLKIGEINTNYNKQAPQARIIFTDKSGHFIHDDEPELVLKEILLLMKSITKGN